MVVCDVLESSPQQLKLPAWINEDYFKDILQKDVPDFVKVSKFTPKVANPPGENYTSIMLRIHLDVVLQDGRTETKTYVLKTMLDDDKGGNAVKELALFPKELIMYQKYLPAFEALYKAKGWQVQLAPRSLRTEATDSFINFVFEDLAERKFKNVNRLQGFDFAHMVRVLQKLAEYHAASVIYEQQNGPYPADFQRGFVSSDENHEFLEKIFVTKVNSYKKAIGLWGLEDGEKYIKKFPTYEQYRKCASRTLNTKENAFNVLTHGDFWSSNVMQNYHANGDINEVLLVDYQFCKWGSPADDLLMFLSISPAQDIRMREFEHFVEIYHEHLVKCLTALGYERRLPKLRDLQMEMYKEHTSFFAFLAILNHMPLILMPADKNCNMEVLLRDDPEADEFRLRTFLNSDYVSAMKDLFPFFHRRGIFNFDDYCDCNLNCKSKV